MRRVLALSAIEQNGCCSQTTLEKTGWMWCRRGITGSVKIVMKHIHTNTTQTAWIRDFLTHVQNEWRDAQISWSADDSHWVIVSARLLNHLERITDGLAERWRNADRWRHRATTNDVNDASSTTDYRQRANKASLVFFGR